MDNIAVTGVAVAGSLPEQPARPSARRLHLLLSVQSGIVMLLSVNRLSDATTGFVADNEFLRWVDLNNLILAGLTLVTSYLLIRQLEYDSPRRDRTVHRMLGLTFFVGACLYAASYGNHEVTNYLHIRFCTATTSVGDRFCEIVAYHDDGFSHYLFFTGFTIISVTIMLTQLVFPDRRRPHAAGTALLGLNALVLAAAIVANLGFEEIGLDLYVVAAVAVLAVALLIRQPRQPILRYYSIAYVVGLVGAVVAQLA